MVFFSSHRGRAPYGTDLLQKCSRRDRARLRLEELEGRTLPATITWINPTGGDWDVTTNWSTGHLPGPTDDAVIDWPGVTVTHTSRVPDSVHTLISQADLNISAGTLSLSGPSVIDGALTLSNATLNGPGDLTLGGLFTWSSGTLSGPGDTWVTGGMVLGSVSGGPVLDNRTLDNAGLATWVGTNPLAANNGAVLNNLAGATFEVQSDAAFTTSGRAGTFANAGTLRKLASSDTTSLQTIFDNSGTVEVDTGTLSLAGGGVDDGTFSVAAGATLNPAVSVNSFGASSLVTGDGTLRFTGTGVLGTTYLEGSVAIANVVISSGTADFVHDVELPNLMLNSGVLAGPGTVTVDGPLVWTGGEMDGPGLTRANTLLNMSPFTSGNLDGRTLDNAGTAILAGSVSATLNASGSVIDNLPGATFEVQAGAVFAGTFVSPCSFNNEGTFRKTVSNGQIAFSTSWSFHNQGSVELDAGTFTLDGGGDGPGSFGLTAGTTLDFAGGTFNLSPGSAVTGPGAVRFSADQLVATTYVSGSFAPETTLVAGGTVDFLNDLSLPSLTLTRGTVQTEGTLTVAGLFAITGGTVAGTGELLAEGGMTISGGSLGVFSRALDNADTATVTDSGGVYLGNGSVFNNLPGALYDLQTDGFSTGYVASGTFNNAGTVRKAGSTGTSDLTTVFNNTGAVDVQTGTLLLPGGGVSSGSFLVAAGATLDFAGGTTTLASEATVSGGGTVNFSSHTGTVTADVSASLSVANTVLLGGTVEFPTDHELPSLTLSGGTLTGPGTVTVSGLLRWTGGTMTGTGRTVAESVLSLDTTLFGTGPALDGRTLDNAGSATWTGTKDLIAADGAALNNLAGATFTVQSNDALINAGGVSPRLTNSGTFRKTASSATTRVNLGFINAGTVEVDTGTLALDGGGSSDGIFTVGTEAVLELGGGHSLEGSSSVAGTGTVRFSFLTTTVAGVYTVASTDISGGTLAFLHDTHLPSLSLDNSGTLTGPGNVTVDGSMVVAGGTLTGPGDTEVDGLLSLTGTLTLSGRNLENAGTATVTDAGAVDPHGGAAFTNLPGALFDIRRDGAMGTGGVDGTFANLGTFRKSLGSGDMSVNCALINNGLVNVDVGRLDVGSRSGLSNGAFVMAAGTTLDWSGALGPNSTISGPAGTTLTLFGDTSVAGTISVGATIISGNVEFTRDTHLASLNFISGSLSGPADVTVDGLLTWTGGSMIGPGRTLANGGLALSGFGLVGLDHRELDNAATATWTGNGLLSADDGAIFNNLPGATFDIQNDSSMLDQGGNPSFINAGTVRKSAGTGTTSIGLLFTNRGTLDIQTGKLSVAGQLTNYAGATQTLTGGTYRVRGTFQFPNTGITTSGAEIILDGPASQIVNQSNADALAGFGTNLETGNLELQNGRVLTTNTNFWNAGRVSLDSASHLTLPYGSYTQAAGITDLGGGVLDVLIPRPTVDIEAGILTGPGTVNSSVVNAGQISPGVNGAPGLLTVNGLYTQTTTGVLTIVLAGVMPGSQYSQLQIAELATLDGTLNVTLGNGFTPQPGDDFLVLTSPFVQGQFAQLNGLDLGGGLYLEPQYSDMGLTLATMLMQGVPLPAATVPVLPFAEPPRGTSTVGLPEMPGPGQRALLPEALPDDPAPLEPAGGESDVAATGPFRSEQGAIPPPPLAAPM